MPVARAGCHSRAIFLLSLLIAAGSCGGGDAAPPAGQNPPPAAGAPPAAVSPDARVDPDARPARPRVVAFGDSLTAGLGLVEHDSYPAVLQRLIDEAGYEFEVVNAGVSGDTTAGAVRRLDWALEGDVRVLIVAFGGNDGLRGLPVAEMKENLTQIITRARDRNVVVVLAGMEAPPNFGQEYATAFRQVFRDVALKEKVLFIPFLLEGVAGHAGLNQADGIHPNATGAGMVARTVWQVLQPLLDQMSGSS